MTTESDILQSATTLVEATLKLPILDRHKRDVINVMLWKITESSGKYKTRYISAGAKNAPKGTKLQHEHVIPRKELIDAIMTEPSRARELLASVIGCTVTKAEHDLLTRVSREQPQLRGWERYKAAGITIIDNRQQQPKQT